MKEPWVFGALVAAVILIGCGSPDVIRDQSSPKKFYLARSEITSVTTVGAVMHIGNVTLPLDSGRVLVVGAIRLDNQLRKIADSNALYDKAKSMLHLYVLGWLDERQEQRLSSAPYVYGTPKPYRIRENIILLEVSQLKP